MTKRKKYHHYHISSYSTIGGWWLEYDGESKEDAMNAYRKAINHSDCVLMEIDGVDKAN